MCRDCGCGEANQEHEHWVNGERIRHTQSHQHSQRSMKLIEKPRRIRLEESVLAKNDRIAAENRRWFEERRIHVLNLISSPGSGKTLLLERTVERLQGARTPARAADPGTGFRVAILTGDQEGDYDARRLRASGAEVLQLNTGSACHLDASMVQGELGRFVRPEHRLLVIENVGNLVCPAAFDLGESAKVALLSCAEGEDKPSKYPQLFREAALIVLTKMDLAPHLDWSLELCREHIRKVNSRAPILQLSARTGEGLDLWLDYIQTGGLRLAS